MAESSPAFDPFLRYMSVEVIAQVIEALAVVIGVGFAMVQVRQYRREKRREAALELMHSFQTPSFAEAMNLVYNLADGLSREEIESSLGEKFHLVYALMTTWESLGILVYMGKVDLDLVDDFFSGPIKISWRKLQGHGLLDTYPKAIWLNPEPRERWAHTPSTRIIAELMEQRMFPLTVSGLEQGMRELS